ncbi:hypothetical protein [Mucilaginibacter pineti]|nr:hypothetical protein [Mucilaginibacter pineti]
MKIKSMLNKNAIIIFCLLIGSFAACKRTAKFDRDKWDEGDGLTFAYRPSMVDDLLQNYKLKGLKYQQVIHLLHRPQLSSTTEMTYDIDYYFKPGKPRYVKRLIISLKDSVVTGAKIYEHTYKK